MQAGIASRFTAGTGNSGLGIAGIASIFLFSGAFSMSYGPVSWIYQSEIFPMNLRAMGTSASTATNWVSPFVEPAAVSAALMIRDFVRSTAQQRHHLSIQPRWIETVGMEVLHRVCGDQLEQ